MKAKILIAGGSGLIGSRLIESFSEYYHFHVLSRSKRENTDKVTYFQWNTTTQELDSSALEGVIAIINLAGAGIADKRWTVSRKTELLASRVDSVATLRKAMLKFGQKLPLYIGASAIGYYGNQGSNKMEESDGPSSGFLSEVTQQWEAAHDTIVSNFARSVVLRIGIVLSTQGGALKEILKPAALGVYGFFGNGSAYYSWVHIDDICNMIVESMRDENYQGIYNATAPEPITIKDLVKVVKAAKGNLGLVMPVPTFALKLALGEMTHMLTDSMRVIPTRLIDQSYKFSFPDPLVAIKDIITRKV